MPASCLEAAYKQERVAFKAFLRKSEVSQILWDTCLRGLEHNFDYMRGWLGVGLASQGCSIEHVFTLLEGCCDFHRPGDTSRTQNRNNAVLRLCVRALLQLTEDEEGTPETSLILERLISMRDGISCTPFDVLLHSEQV